MDSRLLSAGAVLLLVLAAIAAWPRQKRTAPKLSADTVSHDFFPPPEPMPELTPARLASYTGRDLIYANKTIRHPYHQTMAHQRMLANHWIEPDADYVADLAFKRRVIEAQGHVVLDVLPCAEHGCGELLQRLAAWLPARYPGLFGAPRDEDPTDIATGDSRIQRTTMLNKVTGETLDLRDHLGQWKRGKDALLVVSRLVQDDFLIAHPSPSNDGSWICAGGIVAAPGFYLLSDKIGRSLRETHDPVPQFNEKLLFSVERTLHRLRPSEPIERTSWELVEEPDTLFWTRIAGKLPTERGAKAMMPSHLTERTAADCATDDPGKLVLRLDHQTFVKMPESSTVFFGIHPMRRPLHALADRPLLPALLLKVHEEAPRDLMEYKAAPLYEASVLPYLRAMHEGQIQRGLISGEERVQDFRTVGGVESGGVGERGSRVAVRVSVPSVRT